MPQSSIRDDCAARTCPDTDSIDGCDNASAIEALVPASEPSDVVPMLVGATVEEVERELMLQTLARCDGNRTRAARVLGVSVRTMRNKIRQYSADGIDVPASS
ncbi:Fis family transcriptional regulator [Rhodopseudomonas boonkerdii]|uniref:helix-turn-helix domain-containing protein n=1 Tax=Rhodopseudomonas boonkerdii TaxID=475937 RepID=UPI001E28A5A3|nr:helix-turn-helix domain-containing protein [Rhodopseudomonas boonkerdii]UGV25724.1 Fis family transcriptional regulator [Rhodopseudomonas boonkerdii]